MYLEIIDTKTKSIRHTIAVASVNQIDVLRMLAIETLSTGVAFDLSINDIENIKVHLPDGLSFHTDDFFLLRGHSLVDELSYEVHTGRELRLMLDGLKPLAFFSAVDPDLEHLAQIPEIEFDCYVTQSRFVKMVQREVDQGIAMRVIYYALPDQAWRIEAYKLLRNTAKLEGWNDAFTRLEGSLLGYTDEQNDEYLKLKRNRIEGQACSQ